MSRTAFTALTLVLVLMAGCSSGGNDEAAQDVSDVESSAADKADHDEADDDESDEDEAGDDVDESDDADGDGDGDDGASEDGDGSVASLCIAYGDVQAMEQVRFTFTDQQNIEEAEAERAARLADLAEVLGSDAPPGVLAGIEVLIVEYPITADGSEYTDAVADAFNSIDGYIGPVCSQSYDGEDVYDPEPVDPSQGELIVTLDGVGAVYAGQPIEEAAALIGFDTSEPGFAEEAEFCAFMIPTSGIGYDGVDFMVYDGVVQRIDVFEPGPQTPSGIGIGSSADDLVNVYGDQIEFSPHPYDETGSYATFTPTDPGNAGLLLLFEVTNGAVSSFRSGFEEPVNFIEGCA